MGLTERHWFENEEPKLTDQQLEDIAYENEKAYKNGYLKGFHDAGILEEHFVDYAVKIGLLTSEKAEQLLKDYPRIVRCKDCRYRDPEDHKCDNGHAIQWQLPRPDDWFCADGKQKE